MKKIFLRLVICLVLIGTSFANLNAFWTLNDPWSPFPHGTSKQIGDMIIDGASELLQSASEAFLFMNEIELAEQNGLNCGAALQRIDLAAAKVEQALKIFNEIIAVGSEAGYDEGRIGKLKAFNYGQYASENGLSSETMTKVAAYLANGNVLGFYRRHAENLGNLLNTLNHIKDDLLVNKISENKVLWLLLQQYNNTLMFGNYASLVFYQI
jgi:hypothetical protein